MRLSHQHVAKPRAWLLGFVTLSSRIKAAKADVLGCSSS